MTASAPPKQPFSTRLSPAHRAKLAHLRDSTGSPIAALVDFAIDMLVALRPRDLLALRERAAQCEIPAADLAYAAIFGMLYPSADDAIALFERARPGFLARLSPAEQEKFARVLAEVEAEGA